MTGRNPKYFPISTFLNRADAENAAALLKREGIKSMVQDINDCPECYHVPERQVGFMLWVGKPDEKRALDILKIAAPVPFLCKLCGTAPATEHDTVIINGRRETRHYCRDCYSLRRHVVTTAD